MGLVRYGVAPDHQSTKNVIRVFERTLNNPSVEFFGGLEINNSPSIDDYNVILRCCNNSNWYG